MPKDRPGALADETYVQLVAYILQANGSAPGTQELPADPEVLEAMASPRWRRGGGGGLAPGHNRQRQADRTRSIRSSLSPRPC